MIDFVACIANTAELVAKIGKSEFSGAVNELCLKDAPVFSHKLANMREFAMLRECVPVWKLRDSVALQSLSVDIVDGFADEVRSVLR